MQLQDCQNLTPDKVASYEELLSIYKEETVFHGLVKGSLTPLRLIRRGGCPVGYEPIDPPIVYDEAGAHVDKRIAPLLVFSIFEVSEWERSWRRIPDSGDPHEFILADKIRWQLIANEFIDRYNKAVEEVGKLQSKISTFRVKIEEKLVATVCPDKPENPDVPMAQLAEPDQAMALPEPNCGQEPFWPPETEFLKFLYGLWVEGLDQKEKIKRLQESDYRVSKSAAVFLAKPASFLLKQVERATDKKGYVDTNKLANARSTENSRLWGEYRDDGEDV